MLEATFTIRIKELGYHLFDSLAPFVVKESYYSNKIIDNSLRLLLLWCFINWMFYYKIVEAYMFTFVHVNSNNEICFPRANAL